MLLLTFYEITSSVVSAALHETIDLRGAGTTWVEDSPGCELFVVFVLPAFTLRAEVPPDFWDFSEANET